MKSSAMEDPVMDTPESKKLESQPQYGPDPLEGLSRSPIMNDPGLYVEGGISEFSLAFIQPMREIRAEMKPDESLIEYINRRNEDDPDALKKLAYSALPRRIEEEESSGGSDHASKVEFDATLTSSRQLPSFMRGVAALFFHKPA